MPCTAPLFPPGSPYPGQVQVRLLAVPPEVHSGARVGPCDWLSIDKEKRQGAQRQQPVRQPDQWGQQPRCPARALCGQTEAGDRAPKTRGAQAHRPRVSIPRVPPPLCRGHPCQQSHLCPQSPARCAQSPGGCWWHPRGQGEPSCPAGRPKGCRRDTGRRVRTGPGGSGPAGPGCGRAAAPASPVGGQGEHSGGSREEAGAGGTALFPPSLWDPTRSGPRAFCL